MSNPTPANLQTMSRLRVRAAALCSLLVIVLCPGVFTAQLRAAEDAIPFPADSPEHAALSAASSYLADADFMLREDYWKGNVSSQTGKAVRLQFFKGNTYRFFFAIEPEKANAATTLSMRIYDEQSREVALSTSKPAEVATALNFEPKSTGLYLVLMGVQIDESSNPYRDYPAVMFYGFE